MAIDPNLITTIRVGELPTGSLELTDKIPREKGTDLYQGTIGELIAFIAPLISAIQFEVKTLHVNQAYIDDNFDMTPGSTMGLGINLMTGYAIVNGNNGTINKDGRVGIAYGEVTNVIGQVGGEDTHVLTTAQMPNHFHLNGVSDDITNVFVYGGTTEGMPGSATTDLDTGGSSRTYQGKTSAMGGGEAFNVRQRFLVELQVMKL
jgi:hypothetical protein